MGNCINQTGENEVRKPKIEFGTLATNESLYSNFYPSAQLNGIQKETDYFFEINLLWIDSSVFKPHNINYQKRLQVIFKSLICLRSPKGFENYINQQEDQIFFVLVSGSIAQDIIQILMDNDQVIYIFVNSPSIDFYIHWAQPFKKKIKYLFNNFEQFLNYISSFKRMFSNSILNTEQIIPISIMEIIILNTPQSVNYAKNEFIEFSLHYIEQREVCPELEQGNLKNLLNALDNSQIAYQQTLIEWMMNDTFLQRMVHSTFRKQKIIEIFQLRYLLSNLLLQIRNFPDKIQDLQNLYWSLQVPEKLIVDWKNQPNEHFLVASLSSFTSSKEMALNFMKFNGKKNPKSKLILIEIQQDLEYTQPPIPLVKLDHLITENEYLMDLNTFILIRQVDELTDEDFYTGKAIAISFEGLQNKIKKERINYEKQNKYQQNLEHFSIDNFLNFLKKDQERIQLLTSFKCLEADQEFNRLSLLAELYQKFQQLDEQIQCFKDMIPYSKQIYGEKNINSAIICKKLGNLYLKQLKMELSLKYHLEGLNILQDQISSYPIQLATYYNDVGVIYDHLRNFDAGLEAKLQALNIFRSELGEMHMSTAASYNNVGIAYENKQEYQKSLQYKEKALSILKQLDPEEMKEQTANCYNNVGISYELLGNFSLAFEYKLKALKISLSIHGEQHENSITCLNNVGIASEKLGYYMQALNYKKQAFELRVGQHGEFHPETASSLNNTGISFLLNDEPQKGLDCLIRALEIKKKLYGEINQDTAMAYLNVGFGFSVNGNIEKSIEYKLKCLEILQKISSDSTLEIANCYLSLGQSFFKEQKWNESKENIEKCLTIYKRIFDLSHPQTQYAQKFLDLLNDNLKKKE